MDIQDLFDNYNFMAAYKLVEIGYAKNPEKPFNSKNDKKFHEDDVRDHLTGEEFIVLWDYVVKHSNGKQGTNKSSLTYYRDMAQSVMSRIELGNISVRNAELYDAMREEAMSNDPTSQIKKLDWQYAVMAVYKAALTLMVENKEFDFVANTYNMLFDTGAE